MLTEMAAMSLQAYSVGLVFMMLIKVLAPGYYSRQDTKTPVKIGLIAMVANMVFNLILVWPLGHVGLALATSLSAGLNALLLWIGLHRDGSHQFSKQWWLLLRVLLLGSGLLLGWLFFYQSLNIAWTDISSWQRVQHMLLVVSVGVLVYGLGLVLAGLRMRHLRAQD